MNNYKVLKIKHNESCKSWHEILIKIHNVKYEHPLIPCQQTVIILNIPPYCNTESLNAVFQQFGEIENIILSKKPTNKICTETNSLFNEELLGFKTAYVTFKSNYNAEKVLESECTKFVLSDYYLPLVGLKKKVNMYMKQFDRKIEEESLKERQLENCDNEGWITISKRGKHKGFTRNMAVKQHILERDKIKKSRKELLNFYQFQIRESKMKRIEELRKKFEEDKKRLKQMKQNRKFKPFK